MGLFAGCYFDGCSVFGAKSLNALPDSRRLSALLEIFGRRIRHLFCHVTAGTSTSRIGFCMSDCPSSIADLAPQLPTHLPMGLRIRLSIMMVLQYGITGMWWVVLSIYLTRQLGFSGEQVGAVYGTMAVASMVSPLVFGQIADRWISTQYLLAFLHLAGALMLYFLSQMTSFAPFYICVLLYAVLFIPTVSLTNSLTFHQIRDTSKHFPGVRVFGTIGWILAGLFVGWTLDDTTSQPIMVACLLSAVMGIYCLTLPDTPPSDQTSGAPPFVKAFAMLRDRMFLLFTVVSFILSIAITSYFAFAAPFLKTIDIETIAPVASIMAVGQFTEMLLLPLLPFFLKHYGMKWTLVIGMGAWAVRYAIFCVGQPLALVIVGVALHGVCCDFYFIAGYIYVDQQASRDMRASAQALYQLVTAGLGMLLGNIIFGGIVDMSTREGVVAWPGVWGSAMIVVAVSVALFAVAFRGRRVATAPTPLPAVGLEDDANPDAPND